MPMATTGVDVDADSSIAPLIQAKPHPPTTGEIVLFDRTKRTGMVGEAGLEPAKP